MSIRKIVSAVALAAVASACAGRDPQMIAIVQPQDATSDCSAITAQINANTEHMAALNKESSNTTSGNVALGVAGAILFWPALFAMDFKDAAGKEAASLAQRQSYLAQLATQRGCNGPAAMR
jgi:hypothetical protein